MIEKRISLKIETGDAKRQLDEIKTSLSGIDKNMPDGSGKAFDGVSKGAKTAKTALINYTGSLSNADRAVSSSVTANNKMQKALLANDTAVRNLNKANAAGTLSSAQLDSALNIQASRHEKTVSSINAEIAATSKLIIDKQNAKLASDKLSLSYEKYSGSISDSERALIKIVGAQSSAEKATLSYDTSVRKLNKELADGNISQAAYKKGLDSANSARSKAVASSDKVSSATVKRNKALIDYTGALSNSNRIVIQSSNYATLAEKASLAQDTALRKLNKNYAEGRIDITAYNSAIADTKSRYAESVTQLNAVTTATGKGAAGFKVMRGGLSQMSYQLQDIAVQAQMGTSWFTIIGQQGPQIASIFGPLGAVLGVVVALGAAFGGVLFKSLGLAGDATKDLESAMSDLDGVLSATKDGAYKLSDSFYELGRASKEAQNLQLALSRFKSETALDDLSRNIEKNTNSISTSFFGLFDDIDISDLSDQFKVLDSVGVKSMDDLNKKLKESKVSLEEYGGLLSSPTQKTAIESLTNTSITSLNDVRSAIIGVGDSLGIGGESARKLLVALDTARIDKTTESFNSLDDVVLSTFDSISDPKKRKAFADLADEFFKSTEAGRKLNAQRDALNENKPQYSSLAGSITEAELYQSQLNATISKSSGLVGELVDIEAKYTKIAKEAYENSNLDVNNSEVRLSARKEFLKVVSDTIAEEDKYIDRQEIINELRKSGVKLTQEESAAVMASAQSQNFLYEKQLAYNNSLKENAKIIGEIYQQGADDYADSVGSMNEGLQGLVTSTFRSMEDAIVSWAETGKLEFTDFVNSAISDLLRLIVQQQLAGIATAFVGGVGGSGDVGSSTSSNSSTGSGSFFNSGNSYPNAKGGAWGSEGRLSRFATGGITGMVNTVQSTPKRFANGSGMLGEAGQAEAIVPLTRTSGGDLGIKSVGGSSAPVINFNVTNEAGVESSSTQSENSDGSIDINIINSLVSKSIASGYADKAITSRFDTKKRGK